MNIASLIPSRERCSEAGWYAWDFILDEPIDDAFIFGLKPWGSLLYLRMLKKPFFKVENSCYLLKGMKGDNLFRMAVHGDCEKEIQRMKEFVEAL